MGIPSTPSLPPAQGALLAPLPLPDRPPDPLAAWHQRLQVWRRADGIWLHAGSAADPTAAVELAREHRPARVYRGLRLVLSVSPSGRARGELVRRRPARPPGEPGWVPVLARLEADLGRLTEARDGALISELGVDRRRARQLVRALATGRLELRIPRYAIRLEQEGRRWLVRRGR